MKAVLDSLGVSYVVEQGQDDSGNWYRRFSNGWVEQGGLLPKETSVDYLVTLPVEFASDDYKVTTGSQITLANFTTSIVVGYFNQTTTDFRLAIGSQSDGCSWEAKGFAA